MQGWYTLIWIPKGKCLTLNICSMPYSAPRAHRYRHKIVPSPIHFRRRLCSLIFGMWYKTIKTDWGKRTPLGITFWSSEDSQLVTLPPGIPACPLSSSAPHQSPFLNALYQAAINGPGCETRGPACTQWHVVHRFAVSPVLCLVLKVCFEVSLGTKWKTSKQTKATWNEIFPLVVEKGMLSQMSIT